MVFSATVEPVGVVEIDSLIFVGVGSVKMSPITEIGIAIEFDKLIADEMAELSVMVEEEVDSLTLVVTDNSVVSISKAIVGVVCEVDSLLPDDVVVISVDSVMAIDGVLVIDSVVAVGIEDDSVVSVVKLNGLTELVSLVVVDTTVVSVVSVSKAVDIASVVSMLAVDVEAIKVSKIKTVGALGVDPDVIVDIDRVSVASVIESNGFADAVVPALDDTAVIVIFGVVGVVVAAVVDDEGITVSLVTGLNS